MQASDLLDGRNFFDPVTVRDAGIYCEESDVGEALFRVHQQGATIASPVEHRVLDDVLRPTPPLGPDSQSRAGPFPRLGLLLLDSSTNLVNVYVNSLRKKLGLYVIETVCGSAIASAADKELFTRPSSQAHATKAHSPCGHHAKSGRFRSGRQP
jgi:hypothetical protein